MYRSGFDPYTSGEVAPRRVGGTETEYDTQQPGEFEGHAADYALLADDNLKRAGLSGLKIGDTLWLSNGGNLHPDVGRVEYSSGEGASAEELAAGNLASIAIVSSVAAAGDARAFRHSGTVVRVNTTNGLKRRFRSLGYHQNLSTSSEAATQELADLWDTYQATRIWAWGGMVGVDGYELSQKARGMGNRTLFRVGQRTTEGSKPMGWIKVGDGDVYKPAPEGHRAPLARVEGRVVDGGFSRWSAWMQEGAGSLVLRLSERKDVLGPKHPLTRLRLVDAVSALTHASLDLSFTRTYKTLSGEALTAIDINEIIAEYGNYLRGQVVLPAAEYRAVDELFDICARLRRTKLLEGYVDPIKYHVDFAPRLAYLLKFFDMRQLHAGNRNAVDRSLLWSRVQPEGSGLKFWNLALANGRAPDPLGDELIQHYATNPSAQTRAAVRSVAVQERQYRRRIENITWPYIYSRNGRTVWLQPDDNDPDLLKKLC